MHKLIILVTGAAIAATGCSTSSTSPSSTSPSSTSSMSPRPVRPTAPEGGSTSKETSGGVHLRGAIQSVKGQMLTLATSTGPVKVRLAQPVQVQDLVPASRSEIKQGSFVGITSVPGPGGSQRAVEVHVFPEKMRGAGEGSRPWDWPGAAGAGSKMTNGTLTSSKMTNGTIGKSKMTNGTIGASKMTNGTIGRQAGGKAFVVTYKNGTSTGSQTIVIPQGIPVVTFAPGSPSDLKPGAQVFGMATRGPDGTLSASRLLVGKNGLKPPM